jgi:hypothetical protein
MTDRIKFYIVFNKTSGFKIYKEGGQPDLSDYYLDKVVENDLGQRIEHWRPKEIENE